MRKRFFYRCCSVGFGLICLGSGIFASTQELRLFSIESRTGQVRWSVPLSAAAGYATTPVVSNGTVFTKLVLKPWGETQWRYQMAAFQAETGQTIWTKNFDSTHRAADSTVVNFSMPVATPKTLLTNLPIKEKDTYNQLTVLDRQTGEPQASPYRFFQAGSTRSGIFNQDQSLWIMTFEQFPLWKNGCDQAQVALTRQDFWAKEIQWQTDLPDRICPGRWNHEGSMLMANEKFVFVSDGEAIQGWNVNTGKIEIQIPVSGKNIGLMQETLIVAGTSLVQAYDASTGKEKWRSNQPCVNSILANFTLDMNQLYLLCYPAASTPSNRVVAMRLDTGQVRWLSNTSSNLFHTPVTTSDHVVVFDTLEKIPSNSKSYVTALAKNTGIVRSRFPVSRAHNFQSMAADQTHIYLIDRSPRWRHWISHWNPAWH